MGYLIFVNIQDLSYQSIAITQIPQLSTFYFVCLISSYGLEVHKMNLVKNEQLLKEQITKVEEINLVKDRLFRTLSHDIRGPINSLKGVTSLFKQKYFREQELISLVGALDAAVAKTSNLIDNLLAWSKSQIEDYKSLKLNLKLSP
jgi:signal transduction histidine kinase